MKKAQEVRIRRQDAIKQREIQKEKELLKIAENIFEWILNQIDSDTQNGRFDVCNTYIYNDKYELHHDRSNFDLKNVLSQYNRREIFEALNEIVNKEEGFEAVLKFDVLMYETTPGITFDVYIK